MMEERNDPIGSGFTPPPTDLALLSSNEASALCLKAAKGAGMSWGLAEEAGFAAGWLYASGINGPELLLSHLNWIADRIYDDVRPVAYESLFPSGDDPLCPIALGASLSDRCTVPAGTIGPVHAPLLLMPFIHHLARAEGRVLTLRWAGGHVSVSPKGYMTGDIDELLATEASDLTLGAGDTADLASVRRSAPVPIRQSILFDLNAFAMQTTVPSSITSREDAGSADGDND